ncbi:MAG: ATP-binding protein [Bacteroidales bacterium]|nr:ATP-binding protein [Bacteroidales bacterium]
MGKTLLRGSDSDMGSKSKFVYKKRLLWLLISFAGILVACFFVYQYGREKQYKVDKLNSSLQLYNIQIKDAIEQGINPQTFFEEHKDYFSGLRETIISIDGTVLYDSNEKENVASMPNHSNRPEVIDAISNGTGYTVRRLSESVNNEYFYSAMLADTLIIRSALPYSVSLKDVLRRDYNFLWFILGVILIIFVFSYYVTRLYSRWQKTLADLEKEHMVAIHEEQEKIRIKKQLTNNINHELKTPVSAIQGYLETILNNPEMDEKIKNIFLEKCYSQTGRLNHLLFDISTLNRMDEASHMIEKSYFSVNVIIDEIIEDIATQPKEKQMRVNCNIDKEIMIYGNRELMCSIFTNLTNNAMAYSGGRDIFITLLGENETHYIFSYADNGVGVESYHFDHLFERFYRVDAGRSRKLGGTGLGLSIVKNAVIFHGGTISARNREQGGLEFIFSLSKHS